MKPVPKTEGSQNNEEGVSGPPSWRLTRLQTGTPIRPPIDETYERRCRVMCQIINEGRLSMRGGLHCISLVELFYVTREC